MKEEEEGEGRREVEETGEKECGRRKEIKEREKRWGEGGRAVEERKNKNVREERGDTRKRRKAG